MTKDPVCGMDVNENEDGWTSEYINKTYYFCSIHCKNDFDREPKRYVENGEISPKLWHCCQR